DSGGERLGGVREIYLDRETGRPEWVLVDVDSDDARFVPLANASVESSTIRVAHSADAIRNAPGIGAEPRIDQSEERRLYAHYGLGYSETDSGSGLPAEIEPEEPTREHRATGPTPTAWGSEDKPASFETETPDPWATPDKPEPPADPWGEASTPPWRTETAESSWSAAAEEPTNMAPPPADPPTVDELEAADIPEPPAVSDGASEESAEPPAITEDAPAFAATTEPTLEVPPVEKDVVVPSAAGEILAATPEPRVFTPPIEPPRIHSVPPPPEEEPGSAVGPLAERKAAIAAAIGVALVLLFVLRRRR
ncbi:MAG TPA: PRC-barrel domain-containing protein, partial [Solirubrobacter sp.]